jgi:hypothetical protein
MGTPEEMELPEEME